MFEKIIILLLLIGIACSSPIRVARQAPNEAPSSTIAPPEEISETDRETQVDDDDWQDGSCPSSHSEDEPERCRGERLAELLPEDWSREHAKLVLKRGLELLQVPKVPLKRSRRDIEIDFEAKNLLRAITGDPDIGSSPETSQEVPTDPDENYELDPVFVEKTKRRISLQTMQNILELHAKGQKESTIAGKYKWYNRRYLERFQRYVAAGGNRDNKAEQIDNYVKKCYDEARNPAPGDRRRPVHEYNLRNWALDEADRINATDFRASDKWVHNFKKRKGIVSRKVTYFTDRPQRDQANETATNLMRFRDRYEYNSHLFRPHLIINMDQSPFRYEISNLRTLSNKGERDTLLEVDSSNKNTHSYTGQPMITRDGKVVGKLLLCLREEKGSFGPRVAPQVREMEQRFGNVRVYASKSGKMSRALIDDWRREVLRPAMENMLRHQNESVSAGGQCYDDEPRPGPSWASDPNRNLTSEQEQLIAIRNSSDSYIPRPDLLILATLMPS